MYKRSIISGSFLEKISEKSGEQWKRLMICVGIIIFLLPAGVNGSSSPLDCARVKEEVLSLLNLNVKPLLNPKTIDDEKQYITMPIMEKLKSHANNMRECSNIEKKRWILEDNAIETDFSGAYIHLSALLLKLQVLLEAQEQNVLKQFLQRGFFENVSHSFVGVNTALETPPQQ